MTKKPSTARSAASGDVPQDTRGRILELAWSLIAAQGHAGLSLVDLAREAGVSRQTLYLLFGSRAGLLLAMVDHRDARSSAIPKLIRTRETLPPRQAFEPYLRAWFEYLPEVFPVARVLAGSADIGDADAQAAWQSRMQRLRGGYLMMTRALQEAGALRAPWTPAAAADWMYSLTHVDTWHHLVVEAQWPPQQAIDHLVATLCGTLLARD